MMGCEPGKIRRHDEPVTVEGRVLCISKKAVKIWTPIKDEWFPLSQILDCDTNLDEIQEGEEVCFEIPRWLARDKGLI